MQRDTVYFVNRGLPDHDEALRADPGDAIRHMSDFLHDTRDNWVTQTCLFLQTRGVNARLSPRFEPDAICVAHYDDLIAGVWPWHSFIVGVRADRPRLPMGHVRIVQNMLCVDGPDDFFVPHWPQPEIVPRDPSRGARVERVGYHGADYNLCERYRDEAFRAGLRDMGMELVIRDKTDPDCHSYQGRAWADYADVDVVIAVRPDDRAYWNYTKPASKLVNAWMAGCPCVLGKESAFRQFRKSELDFIEVESPQEALDALRRLKNDPALFQSMVEHGRVRAEEYDTERVTDRWVELLEGPITAAFRRWRRRRAMFRGLNAYPGLVVRRARQALARMRPR